MGYSHQTFTSGQVLLAAQAQQIEVNIRDHVHGFSGVSAIGLAWTVGSATTARAVTSADIGSMIECFGDLQLSFLPAAQLGSLFSVSFYNAGSQRVVLAAAAGETIGPDGKSFFVLTPKCSINVYGHGVSPLQMFGETVGQFTLADIDMNTGGYAAGAVVKSVQNIDIPYLFPGDFDFYELRISDYLGPPIANGIPCLQLSVDSLSSVLTGGMANTMITASSFIALASVVISSNQYLQGSAFFRNPGTSGSAITVRTKYYSRGAAGALNPNPVLDNVGMASMAGILNGLRIVTASLGLILGGNASLIGWRY